MGSRVLVVDGGARGHALVWKLAQSAKVDKIYIAPGNGGTANVGENINIQADEVFDLAKFAEKNADYTIVGLETPLSLGIVDIFRTRELPIFGPTKTAAKIEWSKVFAKMFMSGYGIRIPTAPFRVFGDSLEVRNYILNIQKLAIPGTWHPVFRYPVVLKTDGLASGKGVYICFDPNEALEALGKLMAKRSDGKSASIVMEEFLNGPEISVHALSDGFYYTLFPLARDYKPVFDGNRGSNTGGMGAIAPVSEFDGYHRDLDGAYQKDQEDLLRNIKYNIVEDCLLGLRRMGTPFIGCLYPGLKITPEGPKVLEFNARFGDPETQVFMRLLKSDLFEIIKSCIEGSLVSQTIEWHPGFAVCVVLASGGYPDECQTGFPISGIEEAKKVSDAVVFHAGTKLNEGGRLVTSGGRVLSVTAVGDSLQEARLKAYEAVKLISFEGMHYRTDVGLEG